MQKTKVIILAAGRSKRLKPVSDKGLLKFNGKPSLQLKLESLSLEGFENFIVVAGQHNLEAITDLLKTLSYQSQIVVQENLEEGMAGAIKAVAKCDPKNPILIVSNNDTVDQSLFTKLREAIDENKDDGVIVAKKVDAYFPGGYLEHDKYNFVTNIIEKPEPGQEPSDLVNLVYHYYQDPTDLYKTINETESTEDDVYEKSLLTLIKNGAKFKVLAHAGHWVPIKKPLDIVKTARFYAEKEHSKGVHPKAEIHPDSHIRGEVIIEEGAKVDANAVIHGPAYIGKNTIIGVNSFVRDSYIGDNCVIGFSSEVARSYLGDGVWLHQNYVGDSVIGNNVAFGAGTIIGNFRLDEGEIEPGATKLGLVTGDNLRVGIGVNFMPGIKVGSNCMISAGITVAEDIPDNSYVKGKYEIEIRENQKSISPRNS